MSSDQSPVKFPNLPGMRKKQFESPPKIFSKNRPRHAESTSPNNSSLNKSSFIDNKDLLIEYLAQCSEALTPFSPNASSLNDTNGRYSVKAHTKDRETKNLTLPFSNLDNVPSFVVNPKGRVCHFLAYFAEQVPENLKEPSRTRQVEIIYYIESNTLEIIEPTITNSGLCQGKMLKNGQVNNPYKNRIFLIEDFMAGAELNIYGRIYTVSDCDTETKRYLMKLGYDFGEPVEIPNRDGTLESASRVTKQEYMSKRIHRGDEEKVLKFTGIWNGSDVQLFYKIYDNAISLFCINDVNPSDRRATVQMLLKNTKVVKEILDGSEDESTVLVTTSEEVGLGSGTVKTRYFLHWQDLKIGATLPMQGLKVRLLDADKSTREFYKSYGIDLGEAIKVEKSKVELVKPAIPPHTGFGSYDDSITSCQGSLIPHTLKKDVHKIKQFEGVKIQYKAILISPVEPSENPRQFIIVMFLEDDNIQILEIPEKNSGRPAGAFLSKRKLQKHDGSLAVKPQDLYAGARVVINGYTFDIYHCANRTTLNYMEQHKDIWTCCDLNKITKKILMNADQIKSKLSNYDTELSVDTLSNILDSVSNSYNRHEVITFIRYLTDAANAMDTDEVKECITVTQLLNFFDLYN